MKHLVTLHTYQYGPACIEIKIGIAETSDGGMSLVASMVINRFQETWLEEVIVTKESFDFEFEALVQAYRDRVFFRAK